MEEKTCFPLSCGCIFAVPGEEKKVRLDRRGPTPKMPETTISKAVMVSSGLKALGCLTNANQFFKQLNKR